MINYKKAYELLKAVVVMMLFVAIVLLIILLFQKLKWNDGVIGALLGSLIGGFSTFLGAKFTLEAQSRKNFIKETPLRIRRLNSVIDKLNKLHEIVCSANISKIEVSINELFDEAALVDGKVFYEIEKIREQLLEFYYKHLEHKTADGDGNIHLDSTEDYILVKQQTGKLVVEKREYLRKYSDELMKKYLSLYKKLC